MKRNNQNQWANKWGKKKERDGGGTKA